MATRAVCFVKLVQLNLWFGKLLHPALQFVADEKPDILCLQEVFDAEDEVLMPDLMFNSLAHLKQRGEFPYVYFSPTFTMRVANTRASFGNAILSKYPLADTETVFINGVFNHDHGHIPHIVNTRNFQLATVEIGDKKLSLVNHQGYWEPTPIGSETSVVMMHKVHRRIENLPRPLIFAGDFNVIAASKAMRVFDSYLEDLTATHELQTTLSELGKVSDVACDHILVSPDVSVIDFHVDERLISDHFALVMEFEL